MQEIIQDLINFFLFDDKLLLLIYTCVDQHDQMILCLFWFVYILIILCLCLC